MKISSIKQQTKRTDRYSIFVEGKYAFSLSEIALLESKLASGQDLTARQVSEFKKLSNDDKLYNQTLRYVAMRPRSHWEIKFYLEYKKQASPALADAILNKLTKIGLIDDAKLARALVNDWRLLRPASRRKMVADLRKKHISEELIEQALGQDKDSETNALHEIIERKRRQSKYQDDTKLMQYLARQGFSYEDIKSALNTKQ